MNRHTIFKLSLGAALLAGLLLAGARLQSSWAAPAPQQGGPQLTIVKAVDGENTISGGQTIRFTITVSNTGEVTATNVIVRDDYDQAALPAINLLVAESETGGGENDGDVITWRLGDLAPGSGWSASYDATATDAFAAEIAQVSNVAVAQADNMEGQVQDTVVLAVQAPKLTLSMERERVAGGSRVFPGDTVRYTIRYINNGTLDATNAILEATFDGTVVEQVSNVTAGGQLAGSATVRWGLGTVAAGASGNVSYDATIKSVVPPDTKVRSQATIQADRVEPLSVSDSLSLPPQLTIWREREDLNGGTVEPGDTLRFIIHFSNASSSAASDVTVRDDFDEQLAAQVSDISDGGGEVDGTVEWTLSDPLGPGAEKTVSYEIRLVGEINESVTAANTASIFIGGVEVDRAQTTMTIEPPVVEATPQVITVSEAPGIFQDQPTLLAVLVGLLSVIALLAVDGLALLILRRGEWREGHFRLVMEGIAIVVISAAVLILAINKTIGSDGAVSILSSVVGYVLGRTAGGAQRGAGQGDSAGSL